MSHRTRRRLLFVVPVMAVAVVTAACGSSGGDKVAPATSGEPSTTVAPTSETSTDLGTDPTGPRPPVDQAAPDSINGLTVDGDTLWIASIDADTVFQVSRADGTILGRFPTGSGSGPDDVAVAPDGTVYSTGFKNGDIGQIRDGRYSVLVTLKAGVNPITVGADGNIWVGEMADGGSVTRISPDGTTEVVATELPTINAFALDPQGRILAPAGGLQAGEFGGTIIRVDPADGSVTTVARGLPPVMASATGPDGRYLALANVSGQILAVNPDAGTFEVVRTVTEGAPFDNIDVAPDGTIYLSSFVTPTVTEVKPDGTVRVINIGHLAVGG